MKALTVLAAALAVLAESAKLRVLFVGDSFTFVNDLPGQLQHVAKSLGDELEASSSTIGGCTLYYQEAGADAKTAELLTQDWDYIVVQDYSFLPTVKKAREAYLYPAIRDFAARKKAAKVVAYMTWGYHDGIPDSCPTSATEECFPLGLLADLTEPACNESTQYRQTVESFECMGYALARGYLSALDHGADIVAPCGLAWQVARGSQSIPSVCKTLIDSEYNGSLPLELPLRVEGGALPERLLNIRDIHGINKHQNRHGCYLNALVFYATLFGKSPVGAAAPKLTLDWGIPQLPYSADELLTLQKAAEGTVEQCGQACAIATPNLVV